MLTLTPLSPESRARYSAAWEELQVRFIDSPGETVGDADELVTRLIEEQGGTVSLQIDAGGKLVVVTDNTDSFDFKFFKGSYWGGYHFPRHWNLFNRKSLEKLAKKTGFEIAKLTTVVSPVNWVYSIHNSLVAFAADKSATPARMLFWHNCC